MAEPVHVRLLGGFEVSAGGSRVPAGAWRLRKAKTLVKVLALEPGHQVHRDRLLGLLWPTRPADTGRNNLHQVLHAARRAMASVGVDGTAALTLRDDVVVLGADCDVVTDLEQFEDAVGRAQGSGDRDALADALRRWPAELLPEDTYETWLQVHLAQFRERRSQLVMDLVEARLDRDEPELAVTLLTGVVTADPLHEPAHRALMRALAASGRGAEALLVFERLRDALDNELAAEPQEQTRALFRQLLVDGRAGAAQARVPGQRQTGDLPASLTALVGRDRELAEVSRILARTRLLTLTGTGGAGKTSLAVELARRHGADFPGGVYFVELGTLTDGALVVPQVARTLQLQLASQEQPLESLVAQLRQRELLLVLDNCEHLVDSCARVTAALLRGCPALSVLATSREPLRIDGEVTWRTPSLEVPDPRHLPDLEQLSGIASVDLFVRRAAAVTPGFALTHDNAAAVAEVCFRLDGIPLALELAAACTPVLAPRQLADRLGDALTLLRRGGRAAVTRQQTLEATLAWSHDLLSPQERQLFRRLAVFAGSFTLEAVESVCGEGLGRGEVLSALARLVDTSLVVAESRGKTVRYRLLETVRQYATGQLKTAGDGDRVRDRHGNWCLRLAVSRDPERAVGTTDAPASMDVEHDNLRAALAWSLHARPTVALELAVALWRYWMTRGFFVEGRRWLELALEAAPEPSLLRARALVALAVFDIRRGSTRRLRDIGTETADIHRTHGDREGLAQALQTDAVLAFMDGRWSDCWRRCLEAERLSRDCSAPHVGLAAQHTRAMVLLSRGELPKAREMFERLCTDLLRVPATTPPFFPPMMLGYSVEQATGDLPRQHFEETILPGGRVGAPEAVAYVQSNLAYLARLSEAHDEALDLLHEALSRFTTLGDHGGEALALNHLGCLHRARGEHDRGRDLLQRALHLRRVIGDRRAAGLTLANLGVLTAAEGRVDDGIALLTRARDGFRETGDEPGRVATAITMASVHTGRSDYDAARDLLSEALPESEHIPGNHRATAWGYLLLGGVCHRLGRAAEADAAGRSAADLFTALGAVDGAAPLRISTTTPQSGG